MIVRVLDVEMMADCVRYFNDPIDFDHALMVADMRTMYDENEARCPTLL